MDTSLGGGYVGFMNTRTFGPAGGAEIVLSTADLDRLGAAVLRAAWSGDRQSFAAHRTVRTSA